MDPASYVYIPASQEVGKRECRALLEEVGAALWITADGGEIPCATLLPTLWRGDTLTAHASGHNEQFARIDDEVPCRVVVQGPNSYISPRWLPSVQSSENGGAARGRAEGRGVGTWNYQQVQIAGMRRVHRDTDRLRDEMTTLAEDFDEKRIADGCPSDAHRGPWTHDEAPTAYYEAMMHGVVGLELRVTEVKGRFKLGQNRTELDRSGASAGLRERGRGQDLAVADAMDDATPLYEG